jgi:hypothetical protein
MLNYFSYEDYLKAKTKKTEEAAQPEDENKDKEMKEEVINVKIGYNFTSFKHCIKRIHKACQI